MNRVLAMVQAKLKKENITASDLSNKSLVLKFSAFKIEMQPITINIKPPIFDLNKKIKGKVVDAAGKIKIRNNQVILYATDISPENAITKVIGVCITDSDGKFFRCLTLLDSLKMHLLLYQ